MPTPDDEAELDKSKMSFGEHLEELRSALVKSLLALIVGFLIGLSIGWSIVDYIQTPLRAALEDFYIQQAEKQQLERLREMERSGESVPEDLEAAAEAFAEERLVPRELFVNPRDLVSAWNERFSDESDRWRLPDSAADDRIDGLPQRRNLLRLRIYQPLEEDARIQVVALSSQEPFLIYIKASLVAGAIFASPFISYYIWSFVAAGLYKHEKKYIYYFLPISLGLFLAGAALAFFVAIDFVLQFLLGFFAWTGVQPSLRLSEWMSFVLMLPLGFGISFQLPLVMLFLERIGVFTVETYLSKWRIAVLVIAIISMFLTPADPGSMIVMALPLTGLYFAGVAMCRFFPKPQSEDTARRAGASDGDGKSAGS